MVDETWVFFRTILFPRDSRIRFLFMNRKFTKKKVVFTIYPSGASLAACLPFFRQQKTPSICLLLSIIIAEIASCILLSFSTFLSAIPDTWYLIPHVLRLAIHPALIPISLALEIGPPVPPKYVRYLMTAKTKKSKKQMNEYSEKILSLVHMHVAYRIP